MTTRILSDTEQLILLFIARHPRLTGEDIANRFDNGDDGYRSEVSSAVEYLCWNGYADRDERTGAITKREAE